MPDAGKPTPESGRALPEPAGWEGDVVLADGGTVHVRPIRRDDGERLVAFHARLSPESVYYRFFSPKPRLTDKEIEKFTTVDFVDRAALVAMLGDDVVAVARFDRWPGTDEAEVAFVVDDVHHGRGISTLLLEHLVAIAIERGIRRFTAEVLPDNRAMLAVFHRAGFEVTAHYASGIIDVSFDIDPTPHFVESVERREQRAESRSIARLVHPRSIAVIGASDRPGSIGRAVLRNLVTAGFDGPVYPVNPSAPHVGSVSSYPSVLEIPDDVHLAVLAVGADEVRDVVEQCAAKNVRAVIVIATGFADAGPEGLLAEQALVALARGRGMRLVGPASMGVISTGAGGTMYASFAPVPVRRGRVGISLQSGPFGAAVLDLAHRLGMGISTFVSLGNKADVSTNDLLNYWQDDPDTDVVLLYTESVGNPRKFARVARRVSRQKPIVVVKGHREATEDVAVDALFRQAGVVRVATVRQLVDVGRVLAGQPLPRGNRVAVLSNAASPAALALDGFEAAGLVPAAVGASVRRTVDALAVQAVVGDAVDLTYRATPEDYDLAIRCLLADDGVDAMVVIHAPPMADVLDRTPGVIADAAASGGKTVIAVMLGRDEGTLSPTSTVPVFAFAEAAVDALGRAAAYAAWRARPEGIVPTFVDVDHERAVTIVNDALARTAPERGTALSFVEALDLLRCYGIGVPPTVVVSSEPEAIAAAASIGYPIVLKAMTVPVVVRSEAGGVALDVQNEQELRGSYARMRASFGRDMDRAIVQSMVDGGVETILTVSSHPSFGPVVSFGLGGAFADAIGDRTSRAVPLTDLDAEAMIAGSRGAYALDLVGVDRAALAEVVLRLSRLIEDLPAVSRVRLNPVLVSSGATSVVAAEIWLSPIESEPGSPLRRLG